MNKEINERRAKDHQLLEEICREQGVPVELVEQLLQIEKDNSGLMRRNNLFKDIDMALKKLFEASREASKFRANLTIKLTVLNCELFLPVIRYHRFSHFVLS